MKERSEVVAFIESQLMSGPKPIDGVPPYYLRHHYGRRELRDLLDFI